MASRDSRQNLGVVLDILIYLTPKSYQAPAPQQIVEITKVPFDFQKFKLLKAVFKDEFFNQRVYFFGMS